MGFNGYVQEIVINALLIVRTKARLLPTLYSEKPLYSEKSTQSRLQPDEDIAERESIGFVVSNQQSI